MTVLNILPFMVKCAGCRKWLRGQVRSRPDELPVIVMPDSSPAWYNIEVHQEGKGLLMKFYCEKCHTQQPKDDNGSREPR